MIGIRFALSYHEYCELQLSGYEYDPGFMSSCAYKTKKTDCVIS